MSLTSLALTSAARCLIEGDSLNDTAFPYQAFRPLVEAAGSYYGGATSVSYNSQGRTLTARPIFRNQAVNGSRLSDINSRIVAELAANPYTHVFLGVGTNQRAINRTTTQNDFVTLMDACTGGGRKVFVVGPYAWGEKWPSGQNDVAGNDDPALDNTSADMKVIINGGTTTDAVTFPGYANAMFVDLRTTLYAVTMPPLNTPGPGATIGPYTVDGTHFNPRGRAALAAAWLPLVTFG